MTGTEARIDPKDRVKHKAGLKNGPKGFAKGKRRLQVPIHNSGECANLGSKSEVEASSWASGLDITSMYALKGLQYDSPNGKSQNANFDCDVIRDEILKNLGRIHLKKEAKTSPSFTDATILIDGVPPQNPIYYDDGLIIRFIPPGDHTVAIQKAGYNDWQSPEVIKVEGGKRIEQLVHLVASP